MRWFRGLGGREGTSLVSGVLSVGGLVRFDSSTGAQARMWARQRSTDDDSHNATQEEAEKQRSRAEKHREARHKVFFTLYFQRKKGKMRREEQKRKNTQ